jgi:hypothetical protein
VGWHFYVDDVIGAIQHRCSPPGVTLEVGARSALPRGLGAASVRGPAAQQGGPAPVTGPPSAAPRGGCFRRLRSAPAPDTRASPLLPPRPRCGLVSVSPGRALVSRRAMPLPGARVRPSSFHGALRGRSARRRSAHAPADRSTRRRRTPAIADAARPIVRPRLTPPLHSGRAGRRGAQALPQGPRPHSLTFAAVQLPFGRPRAISNLVIPRFPCRSRSGPRASLTASFVEASPEKFAPTAVMGGGGVDLAGPVPDRRRFFRSDGGRYLRSAANDTRISNQHHESPEGERDNSRSTEGAN